MFDSAMSRRASLVVALSLLPAALAAQSASAEPATLPSVRVEAGAQETAAGPVLGYAATRSATATKTDTPLNETAQSITVVPRDQIVDQGATSLQDALGYAVGVRSDAYGLDSRSDSVRVRRTDVDVYLNGMRQAFNYYAGSIPAIAPCFTDKSGVDHFVLCCHSQECRPRKAASLGFLVDAV